MGSHHDLQLAEDHDLYKSKSDFSWEHYNRYRPQYPNQIFDILDQYMNDHNQTSRELCVDYGSGPGTIVGQILDHCGMNKVLGTDVNSRQLEGKTSIQHRYGSDRFDILVGAAGGLTTIADNSVDLVTAATAYHWFNQKAWTDEVFRILKPSGTLALWNYSVLSSILSHPEAVVPFNRILLLLTEIMVKPLNMPASCACAASNLMDDFVVDSSKFPHHARYKWLLPESVLSQIDLDAAMDVSQIHPMDQKTKKAGITVATQSDSQFKPQVFSPSSANKVLVRKEAWTTEDVRQYYMSLGFPVQGFFDRDDVKQAFAEIEHVVGGPNATFDVGWMMSLVLATCADKQST